eukprot:15466842-Alexandrium_andersonii.AAC.1
MPSFTDVCDLNKQHTVYTDGSVLHPYPPHWSVAGASLILPSDTLEMLPRPGQGGILDALESDNDVSGEFRLGVKGPFVSTARAESLACLTALFLPVCTHLVTDSAHVRRRLTELLGGRIPFVPDELVVIETHAGPLQVLQRAFAFMTDGDVWQMIALQLARRPPGSLTVQEVKSHLSQHDIDVGNISAQHHQGNQRADVLAGQASSVQLDP